MPTTIAALEPDAVEGLLAAGSAAPSPCDSRPWRFRYRAGGIEVLAEPTRRRPVADPDGRELRIACGCAVFNLRIAMSVQGFEPRVSLLPDRSNPLVLARVERGRPRSARPADLALYDVIAHGHAHQFAAVDVLTEGRRHELVAEAARAESTLLYAVSNARQTRELAELIERAERAQADDPGFQNELAQWGRSSTGSRHMSGMVAGSLLALLCTFGDWPIDHLRAGLGTQRVLLTAAMYQLPVTFVNAPMHVPGIRAEVRRRICPVGHPQLLIRVGQPFHVPQRPLGKVFAERPAQPGRERALGVIEA